MSLTPEQIQDLSETEFWSRVIAENVSDRNYFGLCWPNHCGKCNGWGAFSWYEHHDRGYPGEFMSEPCECVQTQAEDPHHQEPRTNYKCARCGHFGLPYREKETIEGPCEECGWNYDDGMPDL